MARKKGLASLSSAQIVAFIGIILAGYFVIGFGKVALVGYELRSTKGAMEADVAALQQEVANLQAERSYVQTDDYIEQAAREEYNMSRPGDRVVVPMFQADTLSSEQVTETVQPASPPAEPWRAWWELFFRQ